MVCDETEGDDSAEQLHRLCKIENVTKRTSKRNILRNEHWNQFFWRVYNSISFHQQMDYVYQHTWIKTEIEKLKGQLACLQIQLVSLKSFASMYIYMYCSGYFCVWTHSGLRVCVRLCVCAYTRVYMCVFLVWRTHQRKKDIKTHTYAHVCAHTHTSAHTHKRAQTHASRSAHTHKRSPSNTCMNT